MAMMLHKANSRGASQNSWLASNHTFSFSSYHNPDRMGFGVLRVINDDVVQPSMGFPTHPHRNMEIISIPLTGSLRHEDNMGNKHVISAGEIQVMSAGTGVTHSEYNNSDSDDVNFLQIWVEPKDQNINPRYDQKEINTSEVTNAFQLIAAPLGFEVEGSDIVHMNQNAYFSLALVEENEQLSYNKYDPDNGVYFFVTSGSVLIASQEVNARDGIGISDDDGINIETRQASSILCMEVPIL